MGKTEASWIELGNLVINLRKAYSKDILARLVDEYIRKNFRGKKAIVIDGILHPAERDYFQTIFFHFRLVGVKASQDLRISHYKNWGANDAEEYIKKRDEKEQVFFDRGDEYSPNILRCMESARLIEIHKFDRTDFLGTVDSNLQDIIREIP